MRTDPQHRMPSRILPALELAKKEQTAVEQLRTDPPKIVFRTRPSVLLLYDGKPRVRPVEGTNLKRAENTPFFVVRDAAGPWYLSFDGYRGGGVGGTAPSRGGGGGGWSGGDGGGRGGGGGRGR